MTTTQRYGRLLMEAQQARDAERAIPAARQRAADEAAELGRQLVEEFELPADGSPPTDAPAKKAWGEWLAAKHRAEGPWGERQAKAKRAADRCEAAVAKFATENLGALLAEKEPEVREAHREALDAIQGAITAIERLEGERGAVSGLSAYVAGFRAPDDLPMLGLDTLRSDLRKVLMRGVPVPLPASLFGEEEIELDGEEPLHPAEVQRREEAAR